MARTPSLIADAFPQDAAEGSLQLQPGPDHVRTPTLEALSTRALGYLQAGSGLGRRSRARRATSAASGAAGALPAGDGAAARHPARDR